jgi:hypothetical protein
VFCQKYFAFENIDSEGRKRNREMKRDGTKAMLFNMIPIVKSCGHVQGFESVMYSESPT